MSAIAGLLLHLPRSGDDVVISDVCYAGVPEFAHEFLPRLGIEVSFVDSSDTAEVAAAMRSTTKVVYVESPANPVLRVSDIEALARIAHDVRAALVVDSTVATPAATHPHALGADHVVHSLTKYLGGHGDALGGAVLGRRSDLAELRKSSGVHLGGAMSPHSAYLIMRGLDTFALRIAAHSANAMALASHFAHHPRIERVNYPGLPTHPQHGLAARQMRCFSGLMSIVLRGGEDAVRSVVRRLRLFEYAVSLGRQRSLVFHIPISGIQRHSRRLDPKHLEHYRALAGEGVVRISVGLEDAEELCADWTRAFD